MIRADFIIDTSPGGMFAPPGGTVDYAEWLRERAENSFESSGKIKIYYGVAQQLNAIKATAAMHELFSDKPAYFVHVYIFGPHANAAGDVVAELTGGAARLNVQRTSNA